MPRQCVYSDEELLSLMIRVKGKVVEKFGRKCILSMNLFDEYLPEILDPEEEEITSMAVSARFGSWNKAKDLAGLEVFQATHSRPDYEVSECLEAIRKADKYNREVLHKTFLAVTDYRYYRAEVCDKCPPISQIKNKLGWSKAKEMAGLGEGFSVPEYCKLCVEKDKCNTERMKYFKQCRHYVKDGCS